MAALLDEFQKDSTSKSVTIRIIDSGDGTPETGVVFNTSGIDLWYRREDEFKISITEADLTTPDLEDTWETGGFLHISDGEYRLDVPDLAFATGANHVDIGGTVTGMVVIGGRVKLVAYDPEDVVRLGLTSLPNAAADAAGGLPISDLGGLDLDAMNTAAVRLTAVRAAVLTDWIDAGRLDLLLDAIPTTAMRGTDSALTDKAGFSLSTAGILAVWHQALTAIVTAGSVGKLFKDEITSVRMAVLTDWIDAGRLDALLDAIPTTAMRGTDSVVLSGPTKAQMDTAHALLATPAQVNTQVDNAFTTQMADSVPADGTISTREQALYAILQVLTDFSISGTTMTVRKVNGSTALFTLELDDGTSPTDLTRT